MAKLIVLETKNCMHELTLCQNILEILRAKLPKQSELRIKRVSLEIGKLVTVDKDALSFCFALATQNTPLAGAVLNIVEIEGMGKCRDCGHISSFAQYPAVCSECGQFKLETTAGNEFRVLSMEVEACAEFVDVTKYQ